MQSFWRLLGYLRNYRTLVWLNILSNLLTAIFTIVSIPLLKPFFDILFDKPIEQSDNTEGGFIFSLQEDAIQYFVNIIDEQGKEAGLALVCGTILISFFLKNLFRYLGLFFMAPIRNGIIRDIRAQLFQKILSLPLAYFSNEKKGDIISRTTADAQEVENSILNMLIAIFREPIILVGALAYMVYTSPSLTLFVFILIIFTAVVIGGIGKTLKKPSAVVQSKLGSMVSIIEEALSGLRIIKGFNAEPYQQAKFGEQNESYRTSLTRLLWRRDLASPLSEFLGISVVAVLLWYGARQVFTGQLDASTFITFIFAFYMVIDPSKSLSKAYYHIQKGIAAMIRIEEVLDAKTTIVEQADAKSIQGVQDKIEYRGVKFQYLKQEEQVLKGIDLTIPKGKIIAIVGPSGGGKSTLVDLLPRFYDVTEGQILLDGIDVKAYKIKDLRGLIGIVSQEAILFNDTIYNNIVFGLKGVSEPEVMRAAQIANAHEFIVAQEKGYQTNIGDRGNKLSGGQRQRLTIARAILKNPPILILDEATSALDSESEQLVQQALIQLMQNRTSIVIAHRLSTIQHADEIIVMDAGRIVERGTHSELLAHKGLYQKLVAMQAV